MIYYRDGYKYQLTRDAVMQTKILPEKFIYHPYIRLDTDGTLYLRSGYAWDGPSGPTVDTPDTMRASLGHDAFYQLFSEGLLDLKWKPEADELLRAVMVEDGALPMRANLWKLAVKEFGGGHIKPKPELVAPRKEDNPYRNVNRL